MSHVACLRGGSKDCVWISFSSQKKKKKKGLFKIFPQKWDIVAPKHGFAFSGWRGLVPSLGWPGSWPSGAASESQRRRTRRALGWGAADPHPGAPLLCCCQMASGINGTALGAPSARPQPSHTRQKEVARHVQPKRAGAPGKVSDGGADGTRGGRWKGISHPDAGHGDVPPPEPVDKLQGSQRGQGPWFLAQA